MRLLLLLLLSPSLAAMPGTPPTVENAEALARLIGAVRYYHPSDAAAATDWDRFTIHGMRHVAGAETAADLRDRLAELFGPVAPTVAVYRLVDGFPAEDPSLHPEDTAGLEVVAWRHLGMGGPGTPPFYASVRTSRPDSTKADAQAFLDERLPAPTPGDAEIVPLGRGLAARVPLALYSRSGRTLRPAGAPPADALADALAAVDVASATVEDRAVRLANVAAVWAALDSFYPYFDVVDVDWDAVLRRALARAAQPAAGSVEGFRDVLREMVAALGDGHGSVIHRGRLAEGDLPFRVDRVEGRPVVVAVAPGAPADACVAVGDELVALDGEPVGPALAEDHRLTSGSPQWKAFRTHATFGRGPVGSEARVAFDRGGTRAECVVERTESGGPYGLVEPARPEPFAELEDGVFYVDLTRPVTDAVTENLGRLADARGVVLDLRGYPAGTTGVLGYLASDTLRSPRWQTPIRTRPGRGRVDGYNTDGRWTIPPSETPFGGRLVVLADGRAISQAESFLQTIVAGTDAVVAGEASAGANGNVARLLLPGGFGVQWTGMRVVNEDRSQHHLLGVRPTVPVRRTVAGVRAGRDEVLDAAVELIMDPQR